MIYELNWQDYKLLDTSEGKRLERWGEYIFIRPDPQIIWNSDFVKKHKLWENADAEYIRTSGGTNGGGSWKMNRRIPEYWDMEYSALGLKFKISPMGFKHMGLFPEQAANWNFIYDIILKSNREISVLNLFAYTGGATVAAAKAGATVCHVDASKGMIQFAKENAELSKIPYNRVRYIADDCVKFVEREIRRGKKYDAVILDPPSYGRGSNGEMWKIEHDLHNLLKKITLLLSDTPLFILINLYTAGLAPSCAGYALSLAISDLKAKTEIYSDEIGLYVEQTGIAFPCGAFSRCVFGV